MKIKIKGRLGGVHLAKNKQTEVKTIEEIKPPQKISLPMSMHLGKPAKVMVRVGDPVAIGTVIGAKDGLISANIHSSVSGRVSKIEERQIGQRSTTVVVIENDFQDRVAPTVFEDKAFHERLSENGIVGMGGAGFPTDVKFMLKENQTITTLIINAAECEPFVTTDRRLIMEQTAAFLAGVQVVLDAYQIPKAKIAIEACSKDAIAMLQEKNTDSRIQLTILPNHYPQGAEKLVLKNVLGQELPLGKLPIDLGAVILNVSTIHSIYEAIKEERALVERIVTVSGSPLQQNKNLRVRIGTPIEALIEACGGFIASPAKLLNGGPMMGKLISSLEEPVTKTTNLILALTAEEAKIPQEAGCIRCGECVNACPVGLQPILISQAYRHQDLKSAEALGVLNCIDCGACSYICPSKIDLLQDIREAKRQVLEAKR